MAADDRSVIRAFVAEAPRESALAARGREFWSARFEVDRQVVERAITRGELPEDTDPDFVIEAVLGDVPRDVPNGLGG